MTDGFETILATADPAVQALARQSRDLIRAVYPAAVEVPWPRQRVVGYGVGPRKQTQHFCYLALHRDHLNLGFNHGVALPDPDRLLRGPGKRLRHTPITTPADLARPALRTLLAAACQDRLAAAAP